MDLYKNIISISYPTYNLLTLNIHFEIRYALLHRI